MNFSFSGINWVAMIVRAISSWSLCLLGEFRKLTERVTTLVDQAFIQGNLTEVSTQMLGPNNLVYVCREGPDAAKKRIDDFMEHWTFPGYHLQHFLALTARATIDLYQGNSFNAYERIAEAWPNIRRTFMLLIPSVKSDIHFIRARAALAASVKTDPLEKKRLLAGAKKDANILHRLKRPYATCWAELVEAGLASIKGDKEHAADLLRKAIESASRCEMKLIKATAQWQLGSILHGAEGAALRKTAEIFMKRQRINEVKAMARVFVPGFSESE